MPDYNEKGQLLYDAVVEKLKMSSSLYILLDKGTGLPYIIEGTVDVYSEEILAKHALHFYENQYHKSLILKRSSKEEFRTSRTDQPVCMALLPWNGKTSY